MLPKSFSLIVLILGCLQACDTASDRAGHDQEGALPADSVADTLSTDREGATVNRPYRNTTFQVDVQYPANWQVAEDSTDPDSPIITVYHHDPAKPVQLPLTVHAEADVSFIGFFPKGLGTELPFGESKSVHEYQGTIPVSFPLDRQASMVFLLENGEPWGYFLKPATPPPGWGEFGFVFAQVAVQNFSATCIDQQTGSTKSPEECDPMAGDRLAKHGNIQPTDREVIAEMLSSIRLGTDQTNPDAVSNLIRVQKPLPGQVVQSPLQVKGEARGYWYFEGQFPLEVLNKKHQVIARAPALAQGSWTTEAFVPFQATLSFAVSHEEQGYLVFKKHNASGLPEHERSYTLPVILSN